MSPIQIHRVSLTSDALHLTPAALKSRQGLARAYNIVLDFE